MNRKNYASEQQQNVIQIDLSNESSDESSFYNWTFSETKGRSKLIGKKSCEHRPSTPPPPVISSHSDSLRVKNHSQRVERASEYKYPAHEQKTDCPPHSPIFSFAAENSADRTRAIVRQNFDPVDRNCSVYRNQPLPEENNFANFKSSQNVENWWSRSFPLKPALEPKKLTLTIVDEGPNQKRLSSMNWRLVESELCTVFLDIMRENPGPPPVCCDVSLFLGCAKVIECADKRSLKLYSLAISRLGAVWPGAKLAIVDPNEISPSVFRLRATALVPAEPSTNQAILQCIQSSNPDLPTNNWIVLSVGAPSRLSKERHVIISFDFRSLAAIEQRRGVINYGFETIILKTNRRDMDRMQRFKKQGRKILFESSRAQSLLTTHRKRPWSNVEADEDYEIDDDANSESGSEDDEEYE